MHFRKPKLTDEQKSNLLIKQQQHDHQQQLARIEANALNEELRLKKEIMEAERIERLLANPENGNAIMFNITGGLLQKGKRTKYIQEESYVLTRGESKAISLRVSEENSDYDSTEALYLTYDVMGNGVYLYLDEYPDERSKRIALLRNGNWQCGSHYKKSLNTSYTKLLNVAFFIKEMATECSQPHRRYPIDPIRR